jgi:hypothetical protein
LYYNVRRGCDQRKIAWAVAVAADCLFCGAGFGGDADARESAAK